MYTHHLLIFLAGIIPVFDPAERITLSAKAPLASTPPPEAKGRWGHRAPLSPPSKGAYWLAPGPDAPRAWVRARFAEPWPKGVLLIRAARVKGALEGLGLELAEGRRVRWVAFKGGRLRALSAFTRLRPRRGMRRLEIVALTWDDTAALSAFDADDGAWLGTLGARDLPQAPGRAGLFGLKRGGISLEHLSDWPACARPLPTREDGPPLVLVFDPDHPPIDHGGLIHLELLKDADVYRADLAGLERLLCAGGAPPRRFITELPWRYLDLDYLRLRGRAPAEAEGGGYRLSDSYKDPEMVSDLLAAYHARYPKDTLLRQIGESRGGHPIWALGVAEGIQEDDPRPAFLLNSAHHGSEILSIELTLDALDQLLARRSPVAQRIIKAAVVWGVPLVNPDGLLGFLNVSAALGRKTHADLNGDGVIGAHEGVDLNRNYPFKWGALKERGSRSAPGSAYYRGAEAQSEPETRAMIKLARRARFAGTISYHTGTVGVLAPYTIPGARSPQPNEAWGVAEAIAARLGRHPIDARTFEVKRNLYPVDGTDQDWHRHAHGTLALLIEATRWSPLDMAKRDLLVAHLRPAWEMLIQRFLVGPSLSIRVVDKTGAPVRAEIDVKEIKLREDERWSTRCPHGDQHRYLDAPGTYTVRARVGRREITQRVVVRERAEVTLTLPHALKGARCAPTPP
ncbi:hypothetical protein KKB55_14815 [Myxococcota bacterium]|nr:hypothetical protein [Myxococcota bacterium]